MQDKKKSAYLNIQILNSQDGVYPKNDVKIEMMESIGFVYVLCTDCLKKVSKIEELTTTKLATWFVAQMVFDKLTGASS